MEKENRNNQKIKSPKKKKKVKFSQMSKKRKKRYIRNGLLGGVAVIGVVVVALVLNMFYSIIQETAAFDQDILLRRQPFTILDSNDKPIYTYGPEPVEFDAIPQVMVDALVAAEDSRYYEHNGFDIPRIIKAVFDNIIHGGITSGASTITQQTIKKNYYPDEEQTYTRKIGEIFLAIQADSEMDKDTIMACYLNTIWFGVGPTTQGIKAASHYYFGKSVNQLTLPEAAYLAGVLNAPSAFDAFYDLEAAQDKLVSVLNLMEMHGYITSEECELAKQTKIENLLVKEKSTSLDYEQYQAYIDAVLEEVIQVMNKDKTPEQIEENHADLLNDVLKKTITVHTYMNSSLQDSIEKELATGDAYGVDFYGEDIEVAGSVQDNYTGRVVALLGGRDYVDYELNEDLEGPKVFGYNRATTGKQSPGSSLKPILAYGPGIEFLDWPTFSSITDDKYEDNGGYVQNWDGQTHGSMSFSKALSNSWNITACKALRYALDSVGQDTIIDYLNGLGLTVNDAYDEDGNVIKYGDFNVLYAIGAWSEGITMVQEAGAYATIANGGTYYKPHTINYIENNADGSKIMVDEDVANNAKRALSEQGAFMIRELMRDYTPGNYSYISSAAYDLGLSLGAKSGSSTNGDNEDKGYILTCFTPDYAMAFWTGKDKSSEAISTSNNTTPHAMAAHVLYQLHENGTVHSYSSAPDGVYQATVQIGKEPTDTPILVNNYTPDKYKVTGWYKSSNPPRGGETPSVDPLNTFNVECINDAALRIAFGAYDSKYTDMPDNYDPDKKFNPDFMYGRIMYVTVIRDAVTGAELYKKASKTPELTIDYNVTTEIQVCGRYEFSEQSKLHSEEVCRTIKPTKVNLPDVSYDILANGISIDGSSTTEKRVTVNVDASYPDNRITITVSGDNGYYDSKSYSGDCSMRLNNLPVGNYTVTITEQDKKHTNEVSATGVFSVVDNTPTPPDSGQEQ